MTWWRDAVLYEIYPRSFQDTDGDGVGDLRGIVARLDHVRELGVDAIWLAPIYRSPMRDFGYDITDHCDVDPRFGTLADAERLIAEAHARGIRVVLDLVPNHVSIDHPWFQQARRSRTDPKRDWFVWADPRPGGGPPNNWRSAFRRIGSAWTLDPATGQYYLHHFLREQPDLNWWNAEVRRAIADVMRFWLDRGVDGFRIDVAHGLIKDQKLRNNRWLWTLALRRAGRYGDRWDWDRPEVHDVHRELRTILDAYGDRAAFGELDLDLRRIVRYYGTTDDEMHVGLNLAGTKIPWDARRFRAHVAEMERRIPAHGWPNYALSNHDIRRHATRFDDGTGIGRVRARVAALMLLTLRGIPQLYYGEEIGMVDVAVPADKATDIRSRDGCRTPMQWDASPNAGFTNGEPWLPVAPDAASVNVALERDDPASLYTLYRRILAERRRSAALRRGSYTALRAARDVFAYVREAGPERMAVALNFSRRPAVVPLRAAGARGTLVLSTDASRPSGELALEAVRLGGTEGVLVRIERADGGAA